MLPPSVSMCVCISVCTAVLKCIENKKKVWKKKEKKDNATDYWEQDVGRTISRAYPVFFGGGGVRNVLPSC